jgi:hypothetical protein
MISNLAPLYIVESHCDASHRQNPVTCLSLVRGYRVIAQRREVPHWTCRVSPEMMSAAAYAPRLLPLTRRHSQQISTRPLRQRAGPGRADSLSAIRGFPRLISCGTVTSYRDVGITVAVIAKRCSRVLCLRSPRHDPPEAAKELHRRCQTRAHCGFEGRLGADRCADAQKTVGERLRGTTVAAPARRAPAIRRRGCRRSEPELPKR